jgi:hypothetical protein
MRHPELQLLKSGPDLKPEAKGRPPAEDLEQDPSVVGKEHPVSDLKLVEKELLVPDSLMMLRSENFPNKAFRIRLS